MMPHIKTNAGNDERSGIVSRITNRVCLHNDEYPDYLGIKPVSGVQKLTDSTGEPKSSDVRITRDNGSPGTRLAFTWKMCIQS